jgi:hypothetical protein
MRITIDIDPAASAGGIAIPNLATSGVTPQITAAPQIQGAAMDAGASMTAFVPQTGTGQSQTTAPVVAGEAGAPPPFPHADRFGLQFSSTQSQSSFDAGSAKP